MEQEDKECDMIRILDVIAIDKDLIVSLDNGSLITADIAALLSSEEIEKVTENGELLLPSTNGSVVYWQNGIRIPLKKLLELHLAGEYWSKKTKR